MHPSLSRNIIYPLQEKLLGRPTFSYLKDLERSQWYSREEIEALQLTKLHQLLAIASEHCPWHAGRIQQAKIDPVHCSIEEFKQFFDTHITGKNYTFLVLGDKDLLDMNVLGQLGEIKELSLKELFGY